MKYPILLLKLLHQEAKLVIITVQLLRNGTVYRYQQQADKTFYGHILAIWEGFRNGEIDASAMLTTISSYIKF